MAKALRFPKSRRLTRSAHFQRVRREGSARRGEILTLAVLRQPEPAGVTQAGFITTRRTGNAVVRNRIRRRLREIFRKHQHEIGAGLWLVTIASVRAGKVSFRALEDEWLRLARHASILAP